MPFVFKLKSESVVVVVAVSFPFKEIEIKGEEEANNPEEGNDEEKFRMVGKRMANVIRVESFSCVGQSSQDQWIQPNLRGNGRKFPMLFVIWGRWSRIREAPGKIAAKKA